VVAAAVGVSLAAVGGIATEISSRTPAPGDVRAGLVPEGAGQTAQPGDAASRRVTIAPTAGRRRAFASGCAILRRSGPASRAGLATVPVAAALSRVPDLSKLAHAIARSGLATTLNAARALTIFAPDNAAFEALGTGNLTALLATRPDLVRVLKFHVVTGRVTPTEIAWRHVFTTVAGTKLHLERSGRSLGVNNATVTCGNVQTSNASVYVVSRLVVPG
jgi:uncharacterized surface protein with fasciclin (FAS1) repeats